MRTTMAAAISVLSLMHCTLGHAQGQPAPQSVGVHRVSGNIYMLDTDTSQFAGGNIAVLVGEEGLLLVDTSSVSRTPAIVAALKKLSDQPVRYVINSHCHGDHTGGNAAFQRAGAIVIATDNVRKRIEQKKCDKIDLGLPTITFDSELTVNLDGEEVTVFKLPTSHTDGDAIVYFRKANVVHTGDVFVSINLPFHSKYAGGNILGLSAALRQIISRVPQDAKVIPGHGPLASISDIRRAATALDAMRDAVAQQIAKGKTLDELRKMQVLSPWKESMGEAAPDEYYLRGFYDALVGTPLETRYRLD